MRSDGVSERDYAALMFRVKDRLAERGWPQPAETPVAEWIGAESPGIYTSTRIE